MKKLVNEDTAVGSVSGFPKGLKYVYEFFTCVQLKIWAFLKFPT
jgi:hypothetical protein